MKKDDGEDSDESGDGDNVKAIVSTTTLISG